MKKALFFLLTLIAPVWAVGQSFSGSGSGTSSNPYQITNASQLDAMRDFLNRKVYFKLMNDIDLTDYLTSEYPSQGWLPIGTDSSPFMGELNGNGHKITGLWINRSGHVGFFYKTHKAKLKNLTLSYSRASASSNGYFGSLAAKDSCSYIEKIKISGTSVSGKNRVGGCIGYAYKDTLQNCNVQITTITGDLNNTGGLMGWANCAKCVGCNVESNISGKENIGGIAGETTGFT